MTLSELSSALAERGLIRENELSVPPVPESASPWYVQVMMGFCAWLAGLFFLLFLVLGLEKFVMHGKDNWGVVFLLGIAVCAGAAFLYTAIRRESAFGDQFALAISIAGQSAIVISIGEVWSQRAALWGMLLIEIALVFAMRNRLHRMLSGFLAVIAWALATHEILFHEIPGISWNSVHPVSYRTSPLSVLLWLFVWAPIAYLAYRLVAGEARWMAEGRDALLRPATHGLIAALAIAPLATHPASFWMAMGMGPTLDLTDGSFGATALWPFLSVCLALLALALAFNLRNRPLMGVAILFGLLDVSSFYYVLGMTLLVKSIIMLMLGAGLLISARLLATESK